MTFRMGHHVFAAVAVAATAASAAMTNDFPKVALAAGSAPQYSVLVIDPLVERVAYVLWDGNVKDGFGRVYVWVPGDAKYGTPIAAASGEGNKFPPFTFSSSGSQEVANVSWQLGWDRRTGGGTYSYLDYATGKTITHEGEQITYPVFIFDVNYTRGDRSLAASPQASYPLDVRIYGEMGATTVWTNLPPAFAPWNNLNYWMDVKTVYGEREKSGLSFTGRLYYAHWPCTVRSTPKVSKVDLMVSPYLEAPTYSNAVTYVEASSGIKVEVPFGWYDLLWRFTCPGLNVQSRLDYWVVYSPFPYPPPVPGGP